MGPDEGVPDPPVGFNQENGGPRDVPGVHAYPVPHPVGTEDIPRFVHQDVEGERGSLDILPDSTTRLRQNGDDLNAAISVFGDVAGQFTEPAAAIRSPGPPVKHEQDASAGEIAAQRSRLARR